jgi:hypothetical protein
MAKQAYWAIGFVALLATAAQASEPKTVPLKEVELGNRYRVTTVAKPAGYGMERSSVYEGVVTIAGSETVVIEGNHGSFAQCTKPWLSHVPFFGRFYKSVGFLERKPSQSFTVASAEIASIQVVKPPRKPAKTLYAGRAE